MATLALAGVSAVMNTTYMDRLEAQFRRDVFLLNVLTKKADKNANCTWSVKFDGRSASGAYTEGADMADGDYDSHIREAGVLAWAGYRAGAKISGRAARISAANGSSAINGPLLMEELGDAIDEVANDLGTHLYSGNPAASPTELGGAALAIDGTAGTFAGLASGTYGDWIAVEDTTTAAALTKHVIRTKLLTPVKQACGYRPQFVTVPDDLWDAVKALADEGAQDVKEISVNGTMIDVLAITGVTGVIIDGVPFVNDRHCTAGVMYAWNTRFVELRYIPALTPGTMNPSQLAQNIKALTGKDVPLSEIQQRLRAASQTLFPAIDILAKTGDSHKAMVTIGEVQLAWRRRNAFGKLAVT